MNVSKAASRAISGMILTGAAALAVVGVRAVVKRWRASEPSRLIKRMGDSLERMESETREYV